MPRPKSVLDCRKATIRFVLHLYNYVRRCTPSCTIVHSCAQVYISMCQSLCGAPRVLVGRRGKAARGVWPGAAAERRGDTSQGFQDIYLKAKTCAVLCVCVPCPLDIGAALPSFDPEALIIYPLSSKKYYPEGSV